VLWVEIATPVLFGLAYWQYSLSIELAIALFYISLFMVILVIDLEHGLILNKIVYPAMGWGDVKLAALIGIVTGFPLIIVALLMGIILGGVVAVLLLGLKIKKRKEAIPFGPFLAVATIVTLLWGNYILNWYLGIF